MVRRLRIAVLSASGYAPVGSGAPTPGTHRQLDAVIRRHLPAATATLLAEPRPSADGTQVAWYANLAGQPVRLDALPLAEQSAARERLATRLAALDGLATRLRRDEPALAARLDEALRYPGDENVYVVGGEPVLTFWGHQTVGRPPLGPPVVQPAPARAAVADGGSVPPGDERVLVEPVARRGGLRTLGMTLMALLLLAGAGYGLWRALGWGWWWPPWGPDYARLLADAQSEQAALATELATLEQSLDERVAGCVADASLAAARTEGARLEGVASVLEERVTAGLELCGVRGQLASAEADARRLEEAFAAARGRLTSELDECRVAAAEKQKAADKAKADAEVARRAEAKRQEEAKRKDEAVAKAPASDEPAEKPPARPTETAKKEPTKRPDGLPPCPGERTAEEAPDVALVLDASGSMAFPADAASAEIERQMRNVGGPAGILGSILLGQMGGGPSRLEQAKKGVNNVVRSLPNDVDVGMTVLRRCPNAESLGFFSPSERGRLLGSVNALQPTQGTPLAQGLRGAGQMVDGVSREGVIVVISDGEDSCGGDPCGTARALKMQKPNLTINVVDIIGNGAGACMAAATGGRVISPDSGLEFEKAIRAAAEQAMKPAHCP
jgi:Mg-chelatase subunit ChlD